MMKQRDEIKKIWSECFGDSREYVDWFFDRVYTDADAMLLVKNDKPASSLLLQRYTMRFHNSEVGAGYICGAATRRNYRGKGYMGELMKQAIRRSYDRGDTFLTLIPAHDWLYFFYDRYGFATVFYVDPQRFTALHPFLTERTYQRVDDPYAPEVYEAFSRMERERQGIIHSNRDFINIIDDNRMDGGEFVAVKDDEGSVVAMAWARPDDDEIILVKDLLGDSDDARTGALQQLRGRYSDMPFKLLAAPDCRRSQRQRLDARGMGRIVNALSAFEAVADSAPKLKCAIRLSDPLIAENNHTYLIDRGEVKIDDSYKGRPDFDVSIEVMTSIVFSGAKIGDIINFPTARPTLSLMLD